MNNKVLIKVFFANFDSTYDIFIPINEKLWKIEKLISKSIYDINNLTYNPILDNYTIIDKNSGVIYDKEIMVYDTNIRNGTELVFIKNVD